MFLSSAWDPNFFNKVEHSPALIRRRPAEGSFAHLSACNGRQWRRGCGAAGRAFGALRCDSTFRRKAPISAAMLWRTPSTRSRRSPPVGFINPAQSSPVAKPPAGPEWIHEVKHDGFRFLARKDAGRVTLWSRHGTDFRDRFPLVAEAVRALPAESALLDGEAVVLRADGHSDFEAIRTKRGAARATYVAFDLLQLDGKMFASSR